MPRPSPSTRAGSPKKEGAMHTKTTFCLVILLMGVGMFGPVSGQAPPGLPSIDAILEAREPLVRPDLQAKIAGIEDQLRGTNRFRTLVIEPVELSGSVGRGLTLGETQDDDGGVTNTIDDKTDYRWNITYTIGLGHLTDGLSKRRSSKAKLRRQLTAAKAELQQAWMQDEAEMRARHNDYLEARAKFEASAGGRGQTAEATAGEIDLEAGYLMRKRAIEMLVFAGKRSGMLFEEWERFQPEESTPQATTLARR